MLKTKEPASIFHQTARDILLERYHSLALIEERLEEADRFECDCPACTEFRDLYAKMGMEEVH
jgi:hypothetical protein